MTGFLQVIPSFLLKLSGSHSGLVPEVLPAVRSFNDVLTGDKSNELLYGGAGNDTLNGGAGHDALVGGLDRDILAGNAGPDDFYFIAVQDSKSGANRDKIIDFSHKQGDHINLKMIDANTEASGNQKFKFINDGAFSHTAGELRYDNHVLQGDVNGDGKPDFEIHVNADHLAPGDFVL